MKRARFGIFKWVLFTIVLVFSGSYLKASVSDVIVYKDNQWAVLQKKYAKKLDVSKDKIKDKKLYKFIDSWMGVRYKFGGNSRKGVDCSGLTHILYKQVYGKDISRTVKTIYDETKKVGRNRLREGDLVVFNTKGRKSHIGVYLQNGYFIHASSSRGVVINNLNEPYYKKRFKKGKRVK